MSVVCQRRDPTDFPGGNATVVLGQRYVAGSLKVYVVWPGDNFEDDFIDDQTDTVVSEDGLTGVVVLDPSVGNGGPRSLPALFVKLCYDRIGDDHDYRVEVWSGDADFKPLHMIALARNAKNIGYADYAQDVPEAFFTLSQDDPIGTLIVQNMDIGLVHVFIYRDGILVWCGWIFTRNSTREDVVFYAYGYLAGLYWLHTDWNVQYVNATIYDIVYDAWGWATALLFSPVHWINLGTIQYPVTTSGGSTSIVLPTYNVYWKRILQVMREMTVLGMGDTTNSVLFEVTFERQPRFNFWKNIGQDKPNVVWSFPGGLMRDFQEESSSIYHRNDLLVAGASASDALLRTQVTNLADAAVLGRRQESIFFAWVRDSVELQRGATRRAAVALRPLTDLTLIFHPNVIDPPYANDNRWRITDRVRVRIDRGSTQVDEMRQVTGYQVLFMRGAEHVRVMTQNQPGS